MLAGGTSLFSGLVHTLHIFFFFLSLHMLHVLFYHFFLSFHQLVEMLLFFNPMSQKERIAAEVLQKHQMNIYFTPSSIKKYHTWVGASILSTLSEIVART
jgi:hypothetical protein